MQKKTLLKILVYIFLLIILSLIAYSSNIRPLVGNLPYWNMRISGASADMSDMIYLMYKEFILPFNFFYFLPIVSLSFTLLSTKGRKLIVIIVGVIVSLSLWILFWEVFFSIKTDMFVLQYFLEGYYISNSIYFDGLGSFVMLPLMLVISLILNILVGKIQFKLLLKKFKKVVQ